MSSNYFHFSLPYRNYRDFGKKKQFDPLKLSATWTFLVGYLYRSVIPHHRKNIENQSGYTFIFLSFLIWSFFFGRPCIFFVFFFIYFINFFRQLGTPKMISLKLLTLKLSELWPLKVFKKLTNQISPFTHIFYLGQNWSSSKKIQKCRALAPCSTF